MSTSPDVARELSPSSKPSKKRKVIAETSEPSKKKRKHDRPENGITASQETETPKKDKKDKKKREKKKREQDIEVIPETQETEETEDVELLDAPALPLVVATEADQDDAKTNGTDIDILAEPVAEIDDKLLQSQDPSCFYEKRLSLQLPIPAVSLATTTSSLLSLHLAPLLLTYFPPAEGIVLSFSDPVLSAAPNFGINLPLKPPKSGTISRVPPDETFARCADAFGVCWVWLTVTFLTFRPQSGDEMKGWTNVTSEGFVGLVSYNYFQTAVGKSRIPKSWIWDGPTRQRNGKKSSRRGKLRDDSGIDASQEETLDSQDLYQNLLDSGSGSFVDADGVKQSATQTFKVVDIEMVPGHEKNKWTLQIDGSLLSKEEEASVLAEERQRFENVRNRSRSRSKTPGMDAGEMPLIGGIGSFNREESPS